MINQIQTIRAFAANKLGDLAPALTIDRDHNGNEIANGDRASAVIAAGGNRCRIVLTSAYIEPPLGRIVATDLARGDTIISGGKSDAAWASIETHFRSSGAIIANNTISTIPATATPEVNIEVPDGREPHLGQGVTFHTERNEAIGGMTEIAALVTKIISPTVVSLTVFPQTGELFWRNDLPRRSATRQHNCWDFSDKAPKSEETSRLAAPQRKRA